MGKKEENGGKKPFVVPVHSDQEKKNNRQGIVKSYRGALNGDNNKETMEKVNDAQSNCCVNPNVKGSGNGSLSSGHFKVSEVPKTGGSMIDLLEEVVKVGQAKIKWAIDGDENSRFYHGIINKRRSIQSIRGVMVEGMWIDEPFKIDPDQRSFLERDVSNSEIKKAVWECGMDKAPGPDGFSFGFFRHFWYLVDGEVYEAVRYFFTHFDLPKGCNSFFIALITKIPDANMVKDFRPISLIEIKKAVWECGMDKAPGPDGFSFGFFKHFWYLVDGEVYKAVTYFFTHFDLPKGCNSSFIALILKIPDANMVKDFRPISLIGSIYKIIAKILTNRLVGVLGDIINEVQSAFIEDRQILDGLFILNEVFAWCKRKKNKHHYLRLISRKHMIRPTGEFQFGEGLKQGDPLSSFLFLLVMESLHISFKRVADAGMFNGIKVGGLVNLSHLFYADDAVFVSEWSKRVDAEKVSKAAIKLGCLILKTPFLYLGTYVGGNMNRIQSWDDIVNRVKSRYASCPESIRGKFFNGHETSSKKASWVKWNKVLAPKDNGGLGISSLYALNRGLMFKWVWRFFTHEPTLWSRVIKAIHGAEGNIEGIPRHGVSSCWMNIINEIKMLEKRGLI
nr:RNA-directed DNA polymerase, eukaryota [Tanacetum cinerariifolium]